MPNIPSIKLYRLAYKRCLTNALTQLCKDLNYSETNDAMFYDFLNVETIVKSFHDRDGIKGIQAVERFHKHHRGRKTIGYMHTVFPDYGIPEWKDPYADLNLSDI